MLNVSKKVAFVLVSAAMAVVPAASADGSATLSAWAQKAGQSVDQAMYYPKFAARSSGKGSATYRVTIDRDGDIVKSEKTSSKGHSIMQTAAKRTISRADFPALPESYDGQSLTFVVQLNYGVAASGQRIDNRGGTVTSRRIAQNQAPATASLRIIPTAE